MFPRSRDRGPIEADLFPLLRRNLPAVSGDHVIAAPLKLFAPEKVMQWAAVSSVSQLAAGCGRAGQLRPIAFRTSRMWAARKTGVTSSPRWKRNETVP